MRGRIRSSMVCGDCGSARPLTLPQGSVNNLESANNFAVIKLDGSHG